MTIPLRLEAYVETNALMMVVLDRREFETIVEGLSDALDFTRTIGADAGPSSVAYEQGGGRGTLGEVDFYTSHEGLMLAYESALTRELPVPASVALSSMATSSSTPAQNQNQNQNQATSKAYYNTGAHFLWIGDRTRQLNGAHVEYFRGIRNPIGIKVGPSMGVEELVRVLDGEYFELKRGRTRRIVDGGFFPALMDVWMGVSIRGFEILVRRGGGASAKKWRILLVWLDVLHPSVYVFPTRGGDDPLTSTSMAPLFFLSVLPSSVDVDDFDVHDADGCCGVTLHLPIHLEIRRSGRTIAPPKLEARSSEDAGTGVGGLVGFAWSNDSRDP
ncbi:unnamed protein product [Cyclocybe aegerita]|uniref:Phospho-2-dehydro-3-deoxyheptonate aldolase n=1 Tax=Cyclocybe aegerita TaxID=1973307 RepID=A0A8S0WQM4_CYCAE|nr:unnamed protein product [Cyclocybe aegerita]